MTERRLCVEALTDERIESMIVQREQWVENFGVAAEHYRNVMKRIDNQTNNFLIELSELRDEADRRGL